MLKKLVFGILSLALCVSTLAALPQPACADEPNEPTLVVIIEPEEPTPPAGPEEPGEPDEPGMPGKSDILSNSEYPGDKPHPIVT